jgi:hypothetical protein
MSPTPERGGFGRSFRSELHDAVATITHASIGGSPWADEVECSLDALKSAIDRAIAADPILTEIFERRQSILIQREHEPEDRP